MIIGIGFDLTSLPRIGSSLDRFGESFLRRVLTLNEKANMPARENARIAYVAGRFAAKEAAVKALGTGFARGIGFQDMEILLLPSGAPELRFCGAALVMARKLGATVWHVSITHEKNMVGAMVILESS